MTLLGIVLLVFIAACINELIALKEKHFPSERTLFERQIAESYEKSVKEQKEYAARKKYKMKNRY